MKRKPIILILLIFIVGHTLLIYAEETSNLIENQMKDINFQEMEELLYNLKQQSYINYLQDLNFKEIVKQVAFGQISISTPEVINILITIIFKEFYYQKKLIGKFIIISIVSAIMKNFTESFKNKGVAEMGFYTIYLVFILLLFQSFEVAVIVTKETTETLILIMQSLVPTLMSFMFLSGSISSSSIFHPIILVSVQTMGILIQNIFIPGIFFMTILALINQLSKKQVLKQWIQLLKKGIQWGLKAVAGIFITVLGLQSLTLPILDNFIHKTTQHALGSIPVVGNVLTGAVDTVLNCSILIKQAVGIGGIIVLGVFCITPILKLVSFVLLYKLTAAMIQPLGEQRIVHCMNYVGESCQLLLSCLSILTILFIVSITMMVGMTNIGAIIR
ncbi:MAG: stage III sporulation protein AE [Epulopiscium sp.]|nr:stage III sporulation protein AE [Candidatus Epulonipiscium sp.]